MRVFIRLMAICWIVMLILAIVVLFGPKATSPILGDRLQTIPMFLLQSCAKDAARQYVAIRESPGVKVNGKCPDARLVNAGVEAKTDVSGRELSSEEQRVVSQAGRSHTTAMGFMADGTVIAFEATPGDSQSPIYLTFLALPHRDFMLWNLSRVGRLIFASGLLSLLLAAYFVRPVTRLNGVAERFGAGDLKARASAPLTRRKDELGDLGRTFNEMADRIESMVARYKSFLAHASHELGSPITRLNIALALARRKGGPALDQEHNRIRQEADRLNTLVQELLFLARLESGNELGRQQVLFKVGPVVQEALENAALEAGQINKSVTTMGVEEFTIHGYPDLLLRAIDNILRNGLRFAQREVRIQVALLETQTATTGIILIEDDGPGVSPEDEEAIFEPFFTGSETLASADVHQGSGLGLAIAKQAAIANGGTILARRSSLGGLAVRIELPADNRQSRN